MGRETGNQGTTTPESHKISHKSSYKSQQLDIFSAITLSDPRFYGSPAILFHKARKAGGGVPHDRKAKDQVYSNVRPDPLPSRNFQEIKLHQKQISAPPMSHPSRALLGMYCLVQGQGCRVLRLPLYITKRQLGAFFAIYIYILYQILRHQL